MAMCRPSMTVPSFGAGMLLAAATTHALEPCELTKLTPGDTAAEDRFGRSVFVSGDYAVVGATDDDDSGSNSGSAYVFFSSNGAWVEQAKFTAGDAAALHGFGRSVSLSGDYAVVGAYEDDDTTGVDQGSAYMYRVLGIPDCNFNGVNDACELYGDDCNTNVVPDECDIDPTDPDGNGEISEDCQPNGVPDECDIANGTSTDQFPLPPRGADGVPDECQIRNPDPVASGKGS